MSKLEELIAALEKSEGPSRALDRDIQCTVGGWHRITPSQGGGKHGAFISPDEWNGRDSGGRPILDSLHGTTMHRDVPPVTASIDAAVALVDRVIPGAFWKMSCGRLSIQEPLYAIRLLFGSDEILGEAEGDSLPVTICLATLRAKLSQGEA